MARTSAMSIMANANDKSTLSEIYGLVIENIRKESLSEGLKSQSYTGNPKTGSVEFNRFANAAVKSYGTARTATKGDAVTADKIPVNLDQHKEIVEEVAKFDLDTFGVSDIMRRRADNHVMAMANTLDTAFFATAVSAATQFDPAAGVTDIGDIVEAMIQQLETHSDSYTNGVDRVVMDMVLSPAKYGELRSKLDDKPRANVDTAAEDFVTYHGVRIYSCVRLPAGANALLMARGSVAQPCTMDEYSEPEKIPLSNDMAVSLFFDYGSKALTPELILAWCDCGLKSLTIGSLALSPAFDGTVDTYTAATTNATNVITAVAVNSSATVVIKNGTTTVTNGSAATWETGDNTVTITVTSAGKTKTYTVTVTKS